MASYHFQIASDVSTRDGLAVELVDTSGERILEVFRDENHDGELTFNSFGTVSVPFAVAAELVHLARREFLTEAHSTTSAIASSSDISALSADTEKKDKK